MARDTASTLRALLDRVIDYAGTFPPAGLPCGDAVANYRRDRAGDRAWMLRWQRRSRNCIGCQVNLSPTGAKRAAR